MLKAYKYRLYPTREQRTTIDDALAAARYIYNIALETKIRAWQSANISLSAYDLQKQLTQAKREFPWLYRIPSYALLTAIARMDEAFKTFFRGGGFPKFKSKKNGHSFSCPYGARRVDWTKSQISIGRIFDIPFVASRKFDGEIRTVTISKSKSGRYFASILVKTPDRLPAKPLITSSSTIGIDLGIKTFAVASDGRSFEPNRFLKNSLKRLQRLQRQASRKKKGGMNRKKANLRVALLHEKISNQRADYIHKITTGLIRDNQTETFVVENLNIVGLSKNDKLSRSISDASFGEFFRQMKYKCEWYGKNLIVIDRFAPSSKRCSDCGKINDELTLADREWTCECGSCHDRDLNAAKNIKFFGLNTPVGSRGEPVESRRLRRAKKQEAESSLPN